MEASGTGHGPVGAVPHPEAGPAGDEAAAAEGVLRQDASSFEARMQARRAELEERTTELFPIPRYDEIAAVELQVVEWEDTQDLILRRGRRAALPSGAQTAQNMAGELVMATVAFYEIKPGGTVVELIEDATSWTDMVRAFKLELPDGPPETIDRVALQEICGSQGVAALSASFRMWMGGANTGISREVRRDF